MDTIPLTRTEAVTLLARIYLMARGDDCDPDAICEILEQNGYGLQEAEALVAE